MSGPARDALAFPPSQSQQIDPYLSPPSPRPTKPHVTLTFATSLDSNLALAPGTQTLLSGPESKAMTHYLRSKHDAILIGVGTAIADNPSLNCRIEGVGGYGGEALERQPRPVILDPRGRWDFSEDSKVLRLAGEGKGRAPLVITSQQPCEDRERLLEAMGGKFHVMPSNGSLTSTFEWRDVLAVLAGEGIGNVMIEGGGAVINDLLRPRNFILVDSVIVTVAPTWLGKGGVQVCPEGRVEGGVRVPVGRLKDVKWVPLGEDVVLCGRPKV